MRVCHGAGAAAPAPVRSVSALALGNICWVRGQVRVPAPALASAQTKEVLELGAQDIKPAGLCSTWQSRGLDCIVIMTVTHDSLWRVGILSPKLETMNNKQIN